MYRFEVGTKKAVFSGGRCTKILISDQHHGLFHNVEQSIFYCINENHPLA